MRAYDKEKLKQTSKKKTGKLRIRYRKS